MIGGRYRIGGTYPVNTANANIAPMTVVLIIAFLCAFVVINIVVIKSFDALEEDAKKSMEAGMNAHLAKPLKIERVIATIAKYCG